MSNLSQFLPPSSALILISSASASSSAAIDFTAGINSTYDEYIVEFIGVVPDSGAAFRVQTSIDGGSSWDTTSGNYYTMQMYQTSATPTPTGYSSTTDAFIQLNVGSISTTSAHGGISGNIRCYNLASTSKRKHFISDAMTATADTQYNQVRGAYTRVTTSAVNALRFVMSSGNIASGEFKLYGVRKS